MTESTRLAYLRSSATIGNALLVGIRFNASGDAASLLLDITLFYPQGGGQPYIHLLILDATQGKVPQEKISNNEMLPTGDPLNSTVEHVIGDAEQRTTAQKLVPLLPLPVTLRIDHDRRFLNSRLHTAGHLLDIVLIEIMGLSLTTGKAYHFPDGPHVLYRGQLVFKDKTGPTRDLATQIPHTRDEFLLLVEQHCNKIIRADPLTIIRHASPHDDYAMRCMSIDGFISEIPCGGTHVPHLGLLGPMMRVRKVQVKSGDNTTRISYNLDPIPNELNKN
ncbi:hypothetical protein DI09_6p20 [Mitosporidium daphniae]|uniref:Threonyl/alanyl tRNA synthetase SAD domain-containing protein n=1 Tax=Mitosporidium daphniae TaxID=1485682 RepID=A0A098VN10_9MICR|nr:uncharacterized protein DI09_6p20 [Mitosporidium daphniae]KGG50418.1 hypothetical protein DI09_6p20 [Mitosporidium daphniae]|eukprot:XP_013236905.1 uncharacterized protein DI09_6p20 [Mitosporidium daphniae]